MSVIIRLGTNDYNVTMDDLQKVYILQSVEGVLGLMRDYGYPQSTWGTPIPSDDLLVKLLSEAAQGLILKHYIS